MEAEQHHTAPIETNNGYQADHDLLIRVVRIESDVRHLQSDMSEVKTDMKAGFAKINRWVIAGVITLIGGMLGILGTIIGTNL